MVPQPPSSAMPPEGLGDKLTIETPEQTSLEFSIAGIGSRFLAMALDSVIQTVVVAVLLLVVFLVVRGALGKQSGMWVAAVGILLFFVVFYGYFIFFEAVWNGQTPGKRMVRIRVIKDDGRTIGAVDSVSRNLLRIIDQLPFLYAIGIIVALLNRSSKRLGDFAAGTIVVHERTLEDVKPVWQAAPSTEGLHFGSERLTADDLMIIEAFLNRREALAPDVRSSAAAQIVRRIRPKLFMDEGTTLSDESFLEAIASERRGSGGYAR